jgi:hypothetical protein
MDSNRWCRHYACTKDLLDRFMFVFKEGDSDEALAALQSELHQRRGEVLQHAVKGVWRDVHRALTEDENAEYLDFSEGEYPLRLCISGGQGLNPDWQGEDVVQLVRAEQIRDLCRALEAIDEAWLRGKLLGLEGRVRFSTGRALSDELMARAWEAFSSLRAFFLEAEKAELPVICTIEM